MSGTESARNKLEGLQVLRGAAALLVLWCHLKFFLGRDWTNYSGIPLLATNFGAIGVDIFFVISGFVISMTAAKIGEGWRGFLASRVARIVPLYFAISTYATLEAVISGHLGPRVCGRSVFNTYAFIPLFDGRTFTGPVLVNGWTLSFEMWFYLCLTGLLMLRSANRAWLVLPIFFSTGMILTMVLYQSGPWFLPRFLFHPITLEFCAGCILYKVRNTIGRSAIGIMGALALLFSYLAWHEPSLGLHWTILDDPIAGLHRAIVWGGFAACLVGVMSQIDLKYSWKWPRFLLLLGDASYSIYLVPEILMTTFAIAINHLGKFTGHNLTPPPFWYGTIYILASVGAGIACWKYFELPATRMLKRFLLPDKRPKQIPPVPDQTEAREGQLKETTFRTLLPD